MRWIEAVIACPVFTSMVVYYIEGHKEHLLNTELGHQERTYAARGNIFSYKMPWEAIQMKMHELVSDEEMSTWPMPPVLVAQVIRLVIRNGSEQLFKKVKLLKVRPRVLLGLGQMYLEQGHGECAKTAAAVLHAERARRLQQYNERLQRYYPERASTAAKTAPYRRNSWPR